MLQITALSKTAKLTTPLTTPFHEQYRTTTNKDQHALTVIIFRLSVIKLVDAFSMHICTVLVGVNVDIGIPTYRNFFPVKR
ncbi:hypothetical protein GCZ13_14105 [Escherichia coli]|nr:hypothetical protein [Escherichia coli]